MLVKGTLRQREKAWGITQKLLDVLPLPCLPLPYLHLFLAPSSPPAPPSPRLRCALTKTH